MVHPKHQAYDALTGSREALLTPHPSNSDAYGPPRFSRDLVVACCVHVVRDLDNP